MKKLLSVCHSIASREVINKPSTIGLLTASLLLTGLLLPETAQLSGKAGLAGSQTEAFIKAADNGIGQGIGDGDAAVNAVLQMPEGIAFDKAGNLFIADTYNGSIRKVSRSGVITTIAGTGSDEAQRGSFSGDGGPALTAGLNLPPNIAIDAKGNIFFADKSNHRVRKIDRNGIITTFAGTGKNGFSGDGGPAINARLFEPVNVAVDSAGNLLIVDSGNNRIRKVGLSGTITTIAGSGHYEFSGDGGPAIDAGLRLPIGITVDHSGNIFITDKENNRIRKINRAGIITTVAGNGKADFSNDGGPAIKAALNGPTGVAVDDDGNIFIADSFNHRIRRVDADGIITTVAGNGYQEFSGDGGAALKAGLNYAEGIAIDSDGNLFIADTGNNRIRRVDTSGIITTVAGNGKKGTSDLNITFEK